MHVCSVCINLCVDVAHGGWLVNKKKQTNSKLIIIINNVIIDAT